MKKTLIFLLSIFVFTAYGEDLNIYLSLKGKDSNTGAASAPLKTLDGAYAKIKTSFAKAKYENVDILLYEGDYLMSDVLVFDSLYFGTEKVAVTIKSVGKGQARISTGKRIPASKFKKATSVYYDRLHESAKGKVYVADLSDDDLWRAFNILGEEGETHRSHSGGVILPPKSSDYSILTWNEYALQIAKWPNRGYAHINEVLEVGPTTRWLKPGEEPAAYSLEKPNGGTFKTVEQTDWSKWDAEFKPNGQGVVQGYLHNDWYYQNERLGALENGEISLLHHTRYGVVDSQHGLPRRARVVNLLCELDQPGEWYYDIDEKKLYMWPIAALRSSVNISVAGGGKMLQFDGLSNVSIEKLIFQNGGSLAIEINGGENNKVGACTFQNFVGRGVVINGGKNNGVQSCTFKGLLSAASVSGGSRQTLEHCGNYFVNNEISECRLRGYGVVGIQGCGMTVAHNLFHTMNGALIFKGNDITVEYNEFYNMGWEMGDWNACYTGADWASFGNKFQYNFIHHLMETPGAYPVEGVRNDDLGMGVVYKGNTFYKSGRGGIAFSGAGNDCVNNIALETRTVWQAFYVSKNREKAREAWEKIRAYDDGLKVRGDKGDYLWRAEQHYGKMGWLFEPYLSAYPRMKQIMNDGNPFSPSFGVIHDNYVQEMKTAKKRELENGFYMHGCTVDDLPETTDWEFPEMITYDAFVDPDALNFKMKDDFEPMDGFEKVAFEKIGLVTDEYRLTVPNKDKYRKAIKDKYDGVKSAGGRYDMETAYKRFPLPAYLQ